VTLAQAVVKIFSNTLHAELHHHTATQQEDLMRFQNLVSEHTI